MSIKMFHSNLLQRLASLGVVGWIFFNYPLLSLAKGLISGIPTVFVYLFVVWFLLILLSWVLVRLTQEPTITPHRAGRLRDSFQPALTNSPINGLSASSRSFPYKFGIPFIWCQVVRQSENTGNFFRKIPSVFCRFAKLYR